MPLEIVNGYREIAAVTRKHALFDAFSNNADPYGGGLPSHSEIIRSVRNTSQSDRIRAAIKGLRQGISLDHRISCTSYTALSVSRLPIPTLTILLSQSYFPELVSKNGAFLR